MHTSGYVADGFVVADSDVEYIDSRKHKRMKKRTARREEQRQAHREGVARQQGAAAEDGPESSAATPKTGGSTTITKAEIAPEKTSIHSKDRIQPKKKMATIADQRRARARALEEEASKELEELPLWGGLPTHPALNPRKPSTVAHPRPSTAVHRKPSTVADAPSCSRVRKPQDKPAPSRVRNEQAQKKHKRMTDTFRVSKKPASKQRIITTTTTRTHKLPIRFEELASLRIEQKGFREWHDPLLNGQISAVYNPTAAAAAAAATTTPSNRPKIRNPNPAAASFLTLPGEIRNHIYACLLDDEAAVKLKKQSTTAAGRRRSRRKDPHKDRFTSYQLAHTCRQIRIEYLPLLRRSREVQVCLTQLYEYLDAFHPPEDPSRPHVRPEGNVRPVWHDDALTQGIDVLPLARIAHASAGPLTFVLRPSEDQVRFPAAHELTTLAALVQTYPEWRGALRASRVHRVILSSEEDKTSWYRFDRVVEFKCRRGLFGSAQRKETQLRDLGEWIVKSGLVEREDLSFVFGDEEHVHVWCPTGVDPVRGVPVVEYECCEWEGEGGQEKEWEKKEFMPGGTLVIDEQAERGYAFVGAFDGDVDMMDV